MSNSPTLSRKEIGRAQHVQGALLAREAAGEITLKDPSLITLAHTEEGKPYLTGVDCSLSISHSKGEIVVLLGPKGGDCGVDVQHLDGHRPYRDLASRFIDPQRRDWILAEETPLRFCVVWTRMEAMMKATGIPLLTLLSKGEEKDLPLKSFSYRTEEGLFLLSTYGCDLTPPFAHPLFS